VLKFDVEAGQMDLVAIGLEKDRDSQASRQQTGLRNGSKYQQKNTKRNSMAQ